MPITRGPMTLYKAAELFTLQEKVAPVGKPKWMNLHARLRAEYRGEPAALTGPGLYAVFLRGHLTYIGLYAGKRDRPFGGSVLDRWFKHLTYHSLRAREISFSADALAKMPTLEGPVAMSIAQLSGDVQNSALLGRSEASCTLNKVRFAQHHWDVLGPPNKDGLLEDFSFAYWQLPREWADKIPDDIDVPPSQWVKRHWLRTPEREMIRRLDPVCNSQTVSAAVIDGATVAEVEDAATCLFATFPVGQVDAPFSPVEEEAGSRDDDESVVEDQVSATSIGEALLTELQQDCPAGFLVYATDVPDIRIALVAPIGRIKVIVEFGPKALKGKTHASVAACAQLGFEGRSLDNGKSEFTFDPARHGASDLIALAGAAMTRLIDAGFSVTALRT